MDKNQSIPLSIERFAAYLDNNLPDGEMQAIDNVVNKDESLSQLVCLSKEADAVMADWQPEEMPFDTNSLDFELPQIDANHFSDYGSDFDIWEFSANSSHLTNKEDMILGQLSPNDIQQQYPDTCAIKSQQIILQSHDIDVSEDELVRESIEKGWYTPGAGTSPSEVGNLLEEHGVNVSRYEHASIDDIASELAKGHQIIVGVDSGELWTPGTYESLEDFIMGNGADHALIVSGIDVNPLTGEREVTLTDPGTGEVAHIYTADEFEDAWDDSDNFMVTTDF